jgi:hypothetical protein
MGVFFTAGGVSFTSSPAIKSMISAGARYWRRRAAINFIGWSICLKKAL